MDSKDLPETSGTSDEIAQLREELEQQRSELQSIEVALISRIADVDDDRRHAATRLQRTLQNHREEMDGRLRHQNLIVTITFILFVVIVGILLVFAYAKFDQARQTFSTEVQELRQTLEEVKSSISEPQDQEQTPATREKLSQLSTAVKAITASLERLADEQESMATSAAQTPATDLSIDSNVESQQISTQAPPAPESAKSAEQAPDQIEGTEPAAEPLDHASRQPAETSPEADQPTVEKASTQDASVKEIAETPSDATEEPQAEETLAEPAPAIALGQVSAPAVTAATTAPEPEPEPKAQTPTQEVAATPPETASEPQMQTPAQEVEAAPPETTSEPPTPTPTREVETAPTETTEATKPEASSLPERISVGDRPYTVQLMGFYSLDSLLAFARQHGLTDHPVYDEERYQGRPWFVLIHSLHATKEEAEASVAALPPDLAKLDIWIRKLEPDATLYRPVPRTE